MKMCRKCKHLLPEHAFGPAQWRKDSTPQCRECASTYVKAHRLPRLNWAQDYKVASGCVDCGFNGDPLRLQFDHIVPGNPNKFGGRKTLTAAVRASKATWWKVVDELIHHCEIRCASCHGIRTGRQRSERALADSGVM